MDTSQTRAPKTLLLVDDDHRLVSIYKDILEDKGYEVLPAYSGIQAVEVAEKFSGTIDLLITDLIMPGISGPDVAAQLTGKRPNLKVIYVSGYSREFISHHISKPGINFLFKPVSEESLVHEIRRVLDGTGSTKINDN